MSLYDLYPIPNVDKHWTVPQNFEASFDFRFDEGRKSLMGLYQKGKDMQWDALSRIDWSQDIDYENPMSLPDQMTALYGSPMWERMSEREKAETRRHSQAWHISQFLQGEQAALICSAKIVEQVPDLDSKFYAATQVMDEARHVEAYRKLLDKTGLAYPMTSELQKLVDQALRDSRWDVTYLAMQVVIEGMALAAFSVFRDLAQNRLFRQVNAFVMQDEARHVAFGRLTLRDYYPQLTDSERREREEFLIQACYHMRDRFEGKEVIDVLGLDKEECAKWANDSPGKDRYRTMLFMRIVPIIKDIGLWSEKIQEEFARMGVIQFADIDMDMMHARDDEVADGLDDRQAYVAEVAAQASAAA